MYMITRCLFSLNIVSISDPISVNPSLLLPLIMWMTPSLAVIRHIAINTVSDMHRISSILSYVKHVYLIVSYDKLGCQLKTLKFVRGDSPFWKKLNIRINSSLYFRCCYFHLYVFMKIGKIKFQEMKNLCVLIMINWV